MKKEAIKFIRAEIKWCKDHKKKWKPDPKEVGFINGLRHALRLIQMCK